MEGHGLVLAHLFMKSESHSIRLLPFVSQILFMQDHHFINMTFRRDREWGNKRERLNRSK